MRAFGYLREYRGGQPVEWQRRWVDRWYATYGHGIYEWGGWFRDDPEPVVKLLTSEGQIRGVDWLTERPGSYGLLSSCGVGDVAVASHFGVLCRDVDDALECLPCFLDRGARVVLAHDGHDVTRDGLELLRLAHRDRLLGVGKGGSRPHLVARLGFRLEEGRLVPVERELEYMRYCYRELLLDRTRLAREILASAQRKFGRVRGKVLTSKSLQYAADQYHKSVERVRSGECDKADRLAVGRGFFTERPEDWAELRGARSHRSNNPSFRGATEKDAK